MRATTTTRSNFSKHHFQLDIYFLVLLPTFQNKKISCLKKSPVKILSAAGSKNTPKSSGGFFFVTSWCLSIGIFVDVDGTSKGGALHVGLWFLGDDDLFPRRSTGEKKTPWNEGRGPGTTRFFVSHGPVKRHEWKGSHNPRCLQGQKRSASVFNHLQVLGGSSKYPPHTNVVLKVWVEIWWGFFWNTCCRYDLIVFWEVLVDGFSENSRWAHNLPWDL